MAKTAVNVHHRWRQPVYLRAEVRRLKAVQPPRSFTVIAFVKPANGLVRYREPAGLPRQLTGTEQRRSGTATTKQKPAGFAGGPKDLSNKQPIRGSGTSAVIPLSAGADGAGVFRAGLAALAIYFGFERKLLTFVQRAPARALDGADVNEHVIAAVIGLNEAEA